eukprot:CAMPEP_0198255154 /NCGR_PEP_ID=MMETSP1447-20131203/5348_1 /TAXON_ID=420782 /ORGANISM="Chaetoceros dichaeta, Strain CCMP1751" /LENGTH=537 /DNA_ID=CAMNT_0043941469 /DNA_START=199 /DNA_END=1812 /DNA_ORIENTATION=-
MLRNGGGRILHQAITSVESVAATATNNTTVLGSSLRSLSTFTTTSTSSSVVPPIPTATQSFSADSTRRNASYTTTTLAAPYTNTNTATTVSVARRWKSNNVYKRAAQALGKNMKQKDDPALSNSKSSSKSSSDDESVGGDSTGSSSSSTQSVFEEMMNNATSPISDTTHEQQQQHDEAAAATEVKDDTPVMSSSGAPVIPTMQGHLNEFAPKIVVVGVGGGGGNAVNNMIANQLHGVDFLTLNTDAQHLSTTLTENRIQIGSTLTSGLGCGANPDAGRLAAEESREQITELLADAHMVFITAGMGGGTGTGAAPVVAEVCYNLGILTVGVVTKPFRFEGTQRMRLANEGIGRLREVVDTLIVIPNQNLFHLANDQTSFVDSFAMADNVLLAGVKSITDLMTTPGLINLDFADVQSVMSGMGNAILGTGQSSFEDDGLKDGKKQLERAVVAAEMALANPLLGSDMDIGTAKGMLVNITGGKDMTLFEVDRAAQLITERVQDDSANIIFGSAYDESLDGSVRVSVVATGIEEYSEEKKV